MGKKINDHKWIPKYGANKMTPHSGPMSTNGVQNTSTL